MMRRHTLREIATALGGELRGHGDVVIEGIEAFDRAGPRHITWAFREKFLKRLSTSRAGAVVVPASAPPTPIPSIACDDMDDAVEKLLAFFCPEPPSPPIGVDAAAVIGDDAELGDGVAVGPFVVVGARARIGSGTVLHPGVHVGEDCQIGQNSVLWNHVVIRERCTLGHRVILHPHVVIGSDGFGFHFAHGRHRRYPHGGVVRVDDDVEMGAGCTVDRAKFGETTVGQGTKFDNLVHVGHNVHIGRHCLVVAGAVFGGSVTLKDGAVIGGHVGVREHATIGEGAQVAGQSVVWGDIAPGEVVSGNPARAHREQLRVMAAQAKVLELRRQVKELSQRVSQLEITANHRPSR